MSRSNGLEPNRTLMRILSRMPQTQQPRPSLAMRATEKAKAAKNFGKPTPSMVRTPRVICWLIVHQITNFSQPMTKFGQNTSKNKTRMTQSKVRNHSKNRTRVIWWKFKMRVRKVLAIQISICLLTATMSPLNTLRLLISKRARLGLTVGENRWVKDRCRRTPAGSDNTIRPSLFPILLRGPRKWCHRNNPPVLAQDSRLSTTSILWTNQETKVKPGPPTSRLTLLQEAKWRAKGCTISSNRRFYRSIKRTLCRSTPDEILVARTARRSMSTA